MCSPVLTYGLECVYLNKTGINKLESLQGRCIKEAIGVSKRSHHSDLLTAMGINTVNNIANTKLANLWRRIFKVDSPAADLNRYLLSVYLQHGVVYPNTLLGRLLAAGLNPINCAVDKTNVKKGGGKGKMDLLTRCATY